MRANDYHVFIVSFLDVVPHFNQLQFNRYCKIRRISVTSYPVRYVVLRTFTYFSFNVLPLVFNIVTVFPTVNDLGGICGYHSPSSFSTSLLGRIIAGNPECYFPLVRF